MKTQFAPPERAEKEQLEIEVKYVANLSLIKELIYLAADAFMILNKFRQIVYCNKALIDMLAIKNPETIYGLRMGEAFNCIHADETEEGCGTTAFCKHCGAVNAILNSQKEKNILKEEECHLIAGKEKKSFDFMVRAKTLELSDKEFTLFIARDIGNEKRRHVLERTFFHDILNTAGGVQGMIELLQDSPPEEMNEYLGLVSSSMATLVEEIKVQRDLLSAENGDLIIEETVINSIDILFSVVSIFQNHNVAEGKTIIIDNSSSSKDFLSDQRLLKRVISNMVKNALEAEGPGAVITVGSQARDNTIKFQVHNPRVMPEKVKMQIFQRSFSTKGAGRGIGTYSIKLLGEKYLKGKVKFVSKEKTGTIFSIELILS